MFRNIFNLLVTILACMAVVKVIRITDHKYYYIGLLISVLCWLLSTVRLNLQRGRCRHCASFASESE